MERAPVSESLSLSRSLSLLKVIQYHVENKLNQNEDL